MKASEFKRKLRYCNSLIRVIPGQGRVDGLYLHMPKHPMANPSNGLKHLGAIPSARVFNTLPKHDFWDDSMGGFNRGWTSVLRYLNSFRIAGRPVIGRSLALRVFGDYFSEAKPASRIAKTWAGKERLKEKYQMNALRSNGMVQGSMTVSA